MTCIPLINVRGYGVTEYWWFEERIRPRVAPQSRILARLTRRVIGQGHSGGILPQLQYGSELVAQRDQSLRTCSRQQEGK